MRALLNAPGRRALEQLPAGKYMLTVTVTDRAGNAGHVTAPCAHADGRRRKPHDALVISATDPGAST